MREAFHIFWTRGSERLPSVRGLSLLDHPSADLDADGQLSVSAYADDAALGELCARGCIRARGCGVRVITTKQQLAERWRKLDCEVQRKPGEPADPTCHTP
jgi:hypothetical protein